MSLIKNIKRLEYINYLIKKRATGDLETFAKKNNLCKRAMTDFLQQMKDLGADIHYDRTSKTYYYGTNGEMSKCMFMQYGEILSKEDVTNITCKPDELCFSEKAVFVPCKE